MDRCQDPILDRLMDEALASNADLAMAAARVAEARANAGVAAAARLPSVWAQASGSQQEFPVGQLPVAFRGSPDPDHPSGHPGSELRSGSLGPLPACRRGRPGRSAGQRGRRKAPSASPHGRRRPAVFCPPRGDRPGGGGPPYCRHPRRNAGAPTPPNGCGSSIRVRPPPERSRRSLRPSPMASLVGERERAETTLALLLGRSPREVTAGVLERGAPARLPEMVIPPACPRTCCSAAPTCARGRRGPGRGECPDRVARAGYFPSVSLTAYAGSESVAFSRLFSGPAGIFSFAAALTQPIWNAGRVGFGVDAAEARRDQALARYRQTVASAFKDVRDALASQTASREALAAETTRAAALEHALVAVQKRFDAGIASRLEVLDVERNLLAAELARIDAEQGRRSALADLSRPSVAAGPQIRGRTASCRSATTWAAVRIPVKRRKHSPRPAKPRNLLALAAAGLKAGPHGPSNKALRRRARMALKRGED